MSRFIRWLCSPSEETTLLPSGSVSAAIWVDNQILTIPNVTEALAREAFEALPDRPLPAIAMAQFVTDSAGAKFLPTLALQRLPKDSQICIRAGELLRNQGQPDQALIAADRALAADASSLFAHRLRAGCLYDLKRWEEALREYQVILARPDARDSRLGQLRSTGFPMVRSRLLDRGASGRGACEPGAPGLGGKRQSAQSAPSLRARVGDQSSASLGHVRRRLSIGRACAALRGGR